MNLDEFKTKIIAVMEADPNAVNPMNERMCLYTSIDGKSHCVIGQLAANEGWHIPPFDWFGYASGCVIPFGWPVDEGVEEYMDEVQGYADTLKDNGLTWIHAAEHFRKEWGM